MPYTQPDKLGGQLLPLPISMGDALEHIVAPALSVLPAEMDAIGARLLLLAIAGQESGLAHRYQVVSGKPGAKGPARGLWQFERGGGVHAVMTHPATKDIAKRIFALRFPDVEFNEPTVHALLEYDDILACVFARLLLWADPRPLPVLGDSENALRCYLRNWRPGKPHPERWPKQYQQAFDVVVGEAT